MVVLLSFLMNAASGPKKNGQTDQKETLKKAIDE